jgi:hypothetical protein
MRMTEKAMTNRNDPSCMTMTSTRQAKHNPGHELGRCHETESAFQDCSSTRRFMRPARRQCPSGTKFAVADESQLEPTLPGRRSARSITWRPSYAVVHSYSPAGHDPRGHCGSLRGMRVLRTADKARKPPALRGGSVWSLVKATTWILARSFVSAIPSRPTDDGPTTLPTPLVRIILGPIDSQPALAFRECAPAQGLRGKRRRFAVVIDFALFEDIRLE